MWSMWLIPHDGTSPWVALTATTPQKAAGIRPLPPWSTPSERSTSPDAHGSTRAAGRAAGGARRVDRVAAGPNALVSPRPDEPKSSMFSFPTIVPPAARIRSTTTASWTGVKRVSREPFVVGTPASEMLSFRPDRQAGERAAAGALDVAAADEGVVRVLLGRGAPARVALRTARAARARRRAARARAPKSVSVATTGQAPRPRPSASPIPSSSRQTRDLVRVGWARRARSSPCLRAARSSRLASSVDGAVARAGRRRSARGRSRRSPCRRRTSRADALGVALERVAPAAAARHAVVVDVALADRRREHRRQRSSRCRSSCERRSTRARPGSPPCEAVRRVHLRGRSGRAATCRASRHAPDALDREAAAVAARRRRCRGRARSARSGSGSPTPATSTGMFAARLAPGSRGRRCRRRLGRAAPGADDELVVDEPARRRAGPRRRSRACSRPRRRRRTRSGMSCASAPFIASSTRKPVTPRIDDAPGMTTCGDRPGLRQHV